MDISKAICPECGNKMKIVRAVCPVCGISMDGEFEVSPLAELPLEDQVFIMAFVKYHGSIKRMEKLFSISYPTVKNRLNTIASRIDDRFILRQDKSEILDKLEKGEINVDEAVKQIRKGGLHTPDGSVDRYKK